MAKSTQQAVRTSWRQRLLLVGLGLAVTLLLLAVAEGLLALFGVAERGRFEDPYVGFTGGTDLFFERRLEGGERVWETRPDRLEHFNLQRFAAVKPAGSLRVFTLGGSTTAGRPYDDHVSFSRWLERYLDAAEPGRRHEVINAGGISYASYRVVALMAELVRYAPDVFVVYTGHNEFLEERTYREVLAQGPARRWLSARLGRLRLARLARRALGRDGEGPAAGAELGGEVETRLDVWTGLQAYRRDEELARSIGEHFAYNLERMATIARRRGVRLILVAPVSNLKDFSPFKSEHRAGLAPADRRRFAELLAAGRERLAAGEPQAALVPLAQAAALDAEHAEVHFRLGRARLALGEPAVARRAFVRARELDVAPLRAREELVAAVRRTAERHGLALVDLPRLLEAEAEQRYGHRIPGNEQLLDHVHPRIAVHGLIAERLLAALAATGEVRLTDWSEARRAALHERVLAGLDRAYYARRDLNLGKVLGWAGKLEEAEAALLRAAEVLAGDADLHLSLGTLWQQTGRWAEAAGELERAVELAPASAAARFNLGVVYGSLGRVDEGLAELRQALRLRPDYPEARHNLAVLLRRSGRTEEALAAARQALAGAPGSPEAHRSLALAARQAGRHQEAEAALREALRLVPGWAAARRELAVGLALAGRPEEALAEIDRALGDEPGDAESLWVRGRLLRDLGRAGEAVAALRRAVELAPDHAGAHAELGLLAARAGDLEAALRLLARAVELDPTSAEAHFNLGVARDLAGRPEEAIAAVETAVRLRPEDPRMQLALGLLYLGRGRREEALPHLEAARRGGEQLPPAAAAELGAGS